MRFPVSALLLAMTLVPAAAQTATRSQSGQSAAQQAAANQRLRYGVVVPGLDKQSPSEVRQPYKPNTGAARSGGTTD